MVMNRAIQVNGTDVCTDTCKTFTLCYISDVASHYYHSRLQDIHVITSHHLKNTEFYLNTDRYTTNQHKYTSYSLAALEQKLNMQHGHV